MDAARVGAGWIVGCIIGGLAVIAAGVIATDLVFWFRVLLVGAGLLAILIGVGGILWDVRAARRGRAQEGPVYMPPLDLGNGDGQKRSFQTTSPFRAGSLTVFVNGLQQHTIETDPATGAFELTFAPLVSDRITASWVVDAGHALAGRQTTVSTDISVEDARTWVWQQAGGQTVIWADVAFRVTNNDQTRSATVSTPRLRVGFVARGLRLMGSVRYAPPKDPWLGVEVRPTTRTDPIHCSFIGWWSEGRPVELCLEVLVGGRAHEAKLQFTSRRMRPTDYGRERLGPFEQGPDSRDIHHLEFRPHPNPDFTGVAQMVIHLTDGRTLVSSGGPFDGGEPWQDVARGFIQFADPSVDIRRPCLVVGRGERVAGLFMSNTGNATDLDAALNDRA